MIQHLCMERCEIFVAIIVKGNRPFWSFDENAASSKIVPGDARGTIK